MTTVLVLARSAVGRKRVEGILRWAVLVLLATGPTASAQQPPVHWLNAGAMPPGAIGSLRLERGGPLSGYFQPVRIRAPQGARIALATEGGFSTTQSNDVLVGMQVGPVYRLKLTGVPNNESVEIYPTVEVIDRLYPPPGLSLRYPIPIELTQDELELAARGAFVTRVIYVEDPDHALPIAPRAGEEQRWIEAPTGEDPLVTADYSGRPVAILRIGSRVPNANELAMIAGGAPAFAVFNPNDACAATSSDRQPPAPPGVFGSASSTLNASEVPNRIEPPAEPGAASVYGHQSCTSAGDGTNIDPYGPITGPSDEYLCDGGDYGSPAGVTKDRKIVGLDQEDAISHYDTVDGRTLVTPSNRVCIYAPRFAAVRRVVEVAAHEQPVFVNATLEEQGPAKATRALPPVLAKQRHAVAVDLGQRPPSLFRQRQQAGGLENLLAAAEVINTLAPYANLQIIRTGEISQAEKPRVERAMESAITLTGVQAPQVVIGVKAAQAEVGVRQPGIVYQTSGPEHPKLRLIKLASTGNALPGEEVEFTLRFDNIGDQVIGNVTIADNLATRFEYVPGSAKSSVDADLITESNDAGSLVLRWDIKNPVKPGEGGVLRFKVKVR